MLPALKSEFRKLFTIRSTYILVVLALAMTALLAFLIEGLLGESGSPASQMMPTAYRELIANAGGSAMLFLAIIAILFMAHEYRYNTIMYTLTTNTRRVRVLLAKMVVISGFAAVFAVTIFGFSLLMYQLGIGMREGGPALPAQQFDVAAELGRMVVYYIFYALIGLLVATLVRNIVGAISIFLGLSIIVEPLLGMALKDNAVYLPIAATDTIIGASIVISDKLTPNSAILVSALYLVIGWVVAGWLFVKRDAN